MKRFGTIFVWAGLLCIALLALLIFPIAVTAAIATRHTAFALGGLPLCLGMIVNAASIANIFVNLKTLFNNAFAAAPAIWQRGAMLVPSSARSNDYKWLSTFPKMRKWVGDKVIKSLAAFNYTITNDDWEATIAVDRNDIEDDQLGIYKPQAEMAGFSAKQLPDEIVSALWTGGFTNLCYDGQYFFDTEHPVGNEENRIVNTSNKGVVVLSAASQALAIASLGAARTALRKMKNDEGQSLNVIPDTLRVPPALENVALVLANNDRLDDGKANPFKGTFVVEVDPRLATDTEWYLYDSSKPVKPMIYQERKAPVFVQMTDPQNPEVFLQKKYHFGAEARAAGGYGFWQLAYGSTGLGA
jgi:phage major head subunit gpT-like protein